MQGHLATVTSANESSFLVSSFGNDLKLKWLGGYQDSSVPDFLEPAGGWRWVTDEPWQYTNWGTGEPNNGFNVVNENRLAFWNVDKLGVWNDVANGDMNYRSGYLIEWENPASTIVPLPPAIWGGMTLLGIIALRKMSSPAEYRPRK
jgi:hypothetical protein